MSALPDESSAVAALQDPRTSAQDLMDIAYAYPQLGAAVVRHPNVYPGLLDWLRQFGALDAQRAVAARQGAGPATMSSVGGPPTVRVTVGTATDMPAMTTGSVAIEDTVAVSRVATPAAPAPEADVAKPATALPTPAVVPLPAPEQASLGAGVADAARQMTGEIKDAWKGEKSDKIGTWMDRGEIVGSVMKFAVIGVVVILVLVVGIRSCSSTASAKNVTCSQFNSMTLSQQDATLNSLLSSHGKQTGGSNLFLAHTQVMIGCSGNPGAKINNLINWN